MKRGQVTLYVIVAIIIVLAVGIVVYTQRAAILTTINYVPEDIKPINSEISDCLKSVSEDGIYLIGLQGGYTTIPSTAFETNFSYIGYGYYNGQRLLPPRTQIESELNNYIELMLPKCADFSKFPEFEISNGDVKANSVIYDNFVDVNVQWPVAVKRTATFQLKNFDSRISIRLGKIYNITSTIVSKEISAPNEIDLSYFADINEKEGMTIDMLPFNDTIVYSISDPKSVVNNSAYIFLFANKFK
jgi:hypothetical protein